MSHNASQRAVAYGVSGPCASNFWRCRRCSGISILEALVALAIFAVAVVGLMAGFQQSVRVSTSARHEAEAVGLAERQLRLATLDASPDRLPSDRGQAGRFRWSVELEARNPQVGHAEVVVEWLDRREPQSLRFETLFLFPSESPDSPETPEESGEVSA